MAKKKVNEQVEVAQQPDREPILDKTVNISIKVEELNVILNLLGELPYLKSAQAIQFLRDKALTDLQAQENLEKTPE